MTSLITDAFLFDQEDDAKSVGSVGSDEIVLFVNPNNYTLELDDYALGGEVSAFDPDIIEEENSSTQLKNVRRQDLKRMVEQGAHEVDEAHVKAELVLGIRDKKQVKKLHKEKAIQS